MVFSRKFCNFVAPTTFSSTAVNAVQRHYAPGRAFAAVSALYVVGDYKKDGRGHFYALSAGNRVRPE